MIRELHVYGNIVSVCDNSENLLSSKTQHRGVGKALLQRAEHITKERFGYDKVSVISGEGTRQYYLKMGYRSSMEHGRYMMKHLV